VNSDIHAPSDPLKGFFYALAGSVLVSTNFVTAKYGLRGFNPETFSLVWTSAAAAYSCIIVVAAGHWPQMALPARVIKKIGFMGLTTGVGMILAWAGLARLDPSFQAFLWRFLPVLTILLSALVLGERLMVKELVPVAAMLLGGCLGAVGRWHIVGTGMILTILAASAFAVQMVVAKMLVSRMHPDVLVFYRVAIGALIIALWAFGTGRADFGVAAPYWLVTLLGAFLGPCASFLLTFRSYRHWDLSRSSIVKIVEPLFVLPLSYALLGTLPTHTELLGGCLILIGAFWFASIHFKGSGRR
jgi:drug/metabolite transporter (DMT)-like permease